MVKRVSQRTDSVLRSAFAIGCAAFAIVAIAPAAGLAQKAPPLRVYVTSITPAPLPILTAEKLRQEITRTKTRSSTRRTGCAASTETRG
jgi:hypothetical protein